MAALLSAEVLTSNSLVADKGSLGAFVTYREALDEQANNGGPLQGGMGQNNFRPALEVLAQQESGTAKTRPGPGNTAPRPNATLAAPDTAFGYINRGIAYGEKGDHDRAIADFNKAIELDPKYDEAYYNRGYAYSKKGDHGHALADYNKAIELDPKHAPAYINRGLVYFDKGDFDRAIADYNEAIELDPKYAKAYYNRGGAYGKKGDHDRAMADFNKAIELDPKHAPANTPPPDTAEHERAPTVIGKTIYFDINGGGRTLALQFAVQDASRINESRILAMKLLPDATRYADEQGITRVAIQASQVVSRFFGLFSTSRNYGYVWNKDAVTGTWNLYVKGEH